MADNEKECCPECKKSFSTLFCLRRHIARNHSFLNVDTVAPLKLARTKLYPLRCEQCGKGFKINKHLNYHLRKAHGQAPENSAKGYKCPLCSDSNCYSIQTLTSHYQSVHNITIVTSKCEFKSWEEFEEWKKQVEKSTTSFYVKKRSEKNTIVYKCHRSGSYRPHGTGLRRLKSQGSNKINAFCPAKIKLFDLGEKFIVEFIETHVGHNNDFSHVCLTSEDKSYIASKIASKISFEEIISEMRAQVTGPLEKKNFLTPKDLYNIKTAFNIDGSGSSQNSSRQGPTKGCLRSAICQEASVINFYKSKNTKCNLYPHLKYKDFLFLMMNESQKDCLNLYDSEVICIEGPIDPDSYFKLTSLLVIDDLQQAFPCAFMISNRYDIEVFNIFLHQLKSKVGKLKPKVLMMDVDRAFLDSWLSLMGEPGIKLYTVWGVERDWQRNLNKINDKEKQSEVYGMITSLLMERDGLVFDEKFPIILAKLLESVDTREFGNYFVENYSQNTKLWAQCHSYIAGLDTNFQFEKVHGAFKYIAEKEKQDNSLDTIMLLLMQFVRDKLFNNLTLHPNGGLIVRTHKIFEEHRASEDLSDEGLLNLGNGKWNVPVGATVCLVKKNCDCGMVCSDCNVCIHQYSCSCDISLVSWVMCRHIHLLCRHLSVNYELQLSSVDIPQEDSRDFFISQSKPWEPEPALQQPCLTQQELLDEKKEIMKKNLLEIVEMVSTLDEADALHQLILSLKPALISVRNNSETVVSTVDISEVKPATLLIPMRPVMITVDRTPNSEQLFASADLSELHAVETPIETTSDKIQILVSKTSFPQDADPS